MNINSLSLNPRYLYASAWLQHVPVAHWLVSVLKPQTVVELGTHYGVSFFALCEAAEAFSPRTFVYAVDTWQGDEHSGFYSDDVFQRVLRHWGDCHRKRSRLIRSSFDEAAGYFGPNSIDMLHIDGLHTYDAVKHDFEKWRPKLRDEFVVLFHDINVRERNFGVWKFWDELKTSSEYFAFDILNGHGLGVLVKGARYLELLKESAEILPLLAAKGELVEKLSEANFFTEQVKAEAEQVKAEAEHSKAEAEHSKAEAEQVKAEAEQVKAEAEQSKAEAEKSKAEAEQSKAEAEQSKAEAEQSKIEVNLLRLRLEQTREEYSYYFLSYHRQVEKLSWLRSQRESLIRMLRLKGSLFDASISLSARAMLARRGSGGLLRLGSSRRRKG